MCGKLSAIDEWRSWRRGCQRRQFASAIHINVHRPARSPSLGIFLITWLWPGSPRVARASRDRRTSPKLWCSWRGIGNFFLNRSRLSRLGYCQRSRNLGQQRQANTREHQTRQHRHWQYILLDPLSSQRLSASKDYSLHFVVYPTAGLKGVGRRRAGKVVEVRLEQPECLNNVNADP